MYTQTTGTNVYYLLIKYFNTLIFRIFYGERTCAHTATSSAYCMVRWLVDSVVVFRISRYVSVASVEARIRLPKIMNMVTLSM